MLLRVIALISIAFAVDFFSPGVLLGGGIRNAMAQSHSSNALTGSTPPSPTSTGPTAAKGQGKFIRNITIRVRDVFDNTDETFLYSVANSLKVNTQESVVRRELLFKEGDPYSPFAIAETARNLRLLRYLREIRVQPKFDGDAVDVEIEARDTWTFIPGITYSSGTGRRSQAVTLSDSNFLGSAARIEGRYGQEQQRESFGVVYSDPQFMGTRKNFEVAAIDRSDGTVLEFTYRQPFRSLRQQEAWSFQGGTANTIGRLFDVGTESYIFRQRNDSFEALYTFAGPSRDSSEDSQYSGIYKGQRILSRRYSVGYGYNSDALSEADAQDYETLDLNPNEVNNDPTLLPVSRRFSGPLFRYQNIQPNFISMNYIDRFDRVEDYNLGDEALATLHIAPRQLGSRRNSVIASVNRSRGWKFSDTAFLRGEVGGSTRFEDETLNNTLLRTELKYYNVIGDWFIGDTFLGRHTLVGNFFVDFGEKLDRDRQLLLGADNGLRGYDINSFDGDKRLVLNLEERGHLADDLLQLVSLGTAAFVDVGGSTYNALGTLLQDDLYADVGVGLRIGFPRASGSGIVRIDLAVPLRDGPDGSGAFEPRILFSAGQLFGARLRSEVVGAENATLGVGFDR